MKKETRDRKFKCPYNEKPGKQYTMNCLYFGCIHQINDDCPLKGKENCYEV
jgi:hypothetical protein